MLKKVLLIIPILIIILFLLPVILPLFHSGYFSTDDGQWMVVRLASFHKALKEGQFPVRYLFTLNHGYGYPVLNFLYPLPFYLGELLHLIGFGFIDSIKILFGFGVVFGAITMYLWLRNRFGKYSGVIGAIVYTYVPFRVVEIYHRGSLGEVVALGFVPLVFYFLDKHLIAQKRKYFVLAILFQSCVILSHNVFGLVFFPVSVLYILLISNGSLFQKIKKCVSYVCAVLGVTAFFWFPAVYDLQYTRARSVVVADYSSHFLNETNISHTFGWISMLASLVIASTLLFLKTKSKSIKFFALFILLSSVFFASQYSQIFWKILPLSLVLQFPWRLASLFSFALAFLVGLACERKNVYLRLLMLFFLFVLVFQSLRIMKINYIDRSDDFYSTNDDTTSVKNEYMPKWVKSDPTSRPLVSIEQIDNNHLLIHKVYFPGIRVFIDNKELPIVITNNGEISVEANMSSIIKLKFTETYERLVADLVSVLFVTGLIVKILIDIKKK